MLRLIYLIMQQRMILKILHIRRYFKLCIKANVANLKTKVDKLDIDKLKPVPTDLSKLSDVVKNDVVKKTDYNKLVIKVDNIDSSGLVKKLITIQKSLK